MNLIEFSPVASWCASHQAKFQRVFDAVYFFLPTQADESNTVIDTLRAIIVPDVQGHSAFPAVDQEANDGMMRV